MIEKILQTYAKNGIRLQLQAKKVKNINFRLKPLKPTDEPPFTTLMTVSYPRRLSKNALVESLQNRLAWAIDCQQKQQQIKPKTSTHFNDIKDLESLSLDSEVYFLGKKCRLADLITDFLTNNGVEKSIIMAEITQFNLPATLSHIYKHWLRGFIQNRQDFWQQKVGKVAVKISPYTMKTRWGSCSTHAKTIRLSVWLAQFEPRCTDYVLVHELCHLHEANHSARFWTCVEKTMPDYKIWHNQLKHINQRNFEDDI